MSSIEILELIHFLGDSRIVWNRDYEWKCQMCTKIIFVAMPLWGRDKTTQSSFHLKVPINELYNNFCLTVFQKLLFACVHFAGCRIIMVEWASQGRFVTKQSFKGQNILTTIIIVFCKKKNCSIFAYGVVLFQTKLTTFLGAFILWKRKKSQYYRHMLWHNNGWIIDVFK